jgi:hypothetical protein
MSFQITHEVSFASPNSFLAIILQLPIPKTRLNSTSIQFQCSQAHILVEDGVSKLSSTRLDSTQINSTLLYNRFARTTQKHSLCIVGKAIVACVFVAAGICFFQVVAYQWTSILTSLFRLSGVISEYKTIAVPYIELQILFICFRASRISIVENRHLKWFGI